MRKYFRDIHGNRVNEISHILQTLKDHPGGKVYVGADSQKLRKTIEYAVVIAVRFGHRGCHFIYHKWNVRRRGYGKGDALIERRLSEEIAATMETAERLRENSIHVHQIDFDLNGDPRWKSHKFVQMAVGWAKGLGYNVSIKPDEQVATKAANNLVNV